MAKTAKGFFEDTPEPLPADGYGKPQFRPTCKDNPWIYPMPKISREYMEDKIVKGGKRYCRFVTEWVEVTEDSAPECYQYKKGDS